ncbi:AbrB/MazE/SpoVT family DNA-binding domain-containing protein [Nocardioides carbamazepini]|uniref:AbrB/MazE/SpoVT family DNA-binding domain-containing protein n=1 Tax=Nocardioides carbamazepini TaxID=2854259 RepID=UPI002149D46D|nr:AbrB/MazE/SpoVT family DNA-binding domain-containing protein [Nocardioides carbamazepini]
MISAIRTTIDGAGRIVVPKAIRDAMGLTGGTRVDLSFVDGRIEIELPRAEVDIEFPEGGPPRIVYKNLPPDAPPLTDEMIRETLEAVRERRL